MEKRKSFFLNSQTQKVGLPPGSLVFTGTHNTTEFSIELINYTENGFSKNKIKNFNFEKLLDEPATHWININGISHTKKIQKIGKMFGFDPLILEDIVNPEQRPKIEFFPNCIFISVKMLSYNQKDQQIESEAISLVLKDNLIFTFQERAGDIFDPIRDRIENQKGKVCQKGPDYLLYALLDCIVDHYFYLLDILNEKLEPLEEKVFSEPHQETATKLSNIKSDLIFLRKTLRPIQEFLSELLQDFPTLLDKNLKKYFYDILDHIKSINDTLDSFRDWAAHLMDLSFSQQSLQMNQVMKTLTIVATIFIPITFIVGVYGMNFEWMPELKWKWAYPAVWGIMGVVVIGFIAYFKRKKWL